MSGKLDKAMRDYLTDCGVIAGTVLLIAGSISVGLGC